MANKKEIILSVKDLTINFSTDHGYVQAVRGISFDLYKGETLCIVGESGSGKSVTSKAIMGILSSNGHIVDGSINYEGEDLTKVSEDEFHRIRGKKIGMIFQDPLSSLNPIVKIGKQITEAMLINSSRLKKMREDLVAKELVAYRNAQTEKQNQILKAKDQISFLNSEKKKNLEQLHIHATEKSDGLLFNLKQSYKADVSDVKTDESLSDEVKQNKINELTATYNSKKVEYLAQKKEEKATSKNLSKEKRLYYKEEINKAKANYKKEKVLANETYNDVIKEAKAKYLVKLKEAKAEVKKYKTQITDEFYLKFLSEFKHEKLLSAYTKSKAGNGKVNPFINLYVHLFIMSQVRKNRALIKTHRENVHLLRLYEEYIEKIKITKQEAKARAIEIMTEVGIPQPEKRYKQYPFEFSGGMRQRIVIAIALTAYPDILICDEPTTALDVTIQAQILELINRLKKERNLSCIFITHDLGVVANMADRVAVMYAGKIVEYGTANDIFYDPKHPYTWALLSSIPDVDSKEKLESIPGTPPNMIYPPKGDAFALRSKYALAIDFKKQPPMFKVSDTHYAATWLLDKRAPKVEMPDIVKTRIENALKADKAKKASKKEAK